MKTLTAIAVAAVATTLSTAHAQVTSYVVRGSNARLVYEPTGPATSSINGVQVEPVDTMAWDGVGVTKLSVAQITIRADPNNNTGFVDARWLDANGMWRYHQDTFMPPAAHGQGTVMGPSVFNHYHIQGDAITTNVYLHGDTQDGPPILPIVFTFLATWGPCSVTLNGVPYDNPYDGPTPQWLGHSMTTAGVRDAVTGQVLATDGSIYDMSKSAMGAMDQRDLEVHLVFHDDPMPMTSNNPPMFNANYHVMFEDVQIQIVHTDL